MKAFCVGLAVLLQTVAAKKAIPSKCMADYANLCATPKPEAAVFTFVWDVKPEQPVKKPIKEPVKDTGALVKEGEEEGKATPTRPWVFLDGHRDRVSASMQRGATRALYMVLPENVDKHEHHPHAQYHKGLVMPEHEHQKGLVMPEHEHQKNNKKGIFVPKSVYAQNRATEKHDLMRAKKHNGYGKYHGVRSEYTQEEIDAHVCVWKAFKYAPEKLSEPCRDDLQAVYDKYKNGKGEEAEEEAPPADGADCLIALMMFVGVAFMIHNFLFKPLEFSCCSFTKGIFRVMLVTMASLVWLGFLFSNYLAFIGVTVAATALKVYLSGKSSVEEADEEQTNDLQLANDYPAKAAVTTKTKPGTKDVYVGLITNL